MVGSLHRIDLRQRLSPALGDEETQLTPRTKNEPALPPRDVVVNANGRKGDIGTQPRVLKTTLPAGDPRMGQSAWCAQQTHFFVNQGPANCQWVRDDECGTGSGAESEGYGNPRISMRI